MSRRGKAPQRSRARAAAKQAPKKRRRLAHGRKRRRVRPGRVVSDAVIEEVAREVRRWLWRCYRERKVPLGHLAAEVGLTRQGLAKILRSRHSFLFTTFVRGCFLQPGSVGDLAIDAEGWQIQLRWSITRGNGSSLSRAAGAG